MFELSKKQTQELQTMLTISVLDGKTIRELRYFLRSGKVPVNRRNVSNPVLNLVCKWLDAVNPESETLHKAIKTVLDLPGLLENANNASGFIVALRLFKDYLINPNTWSYGNSVKRDASSNVVTVSEALQLEQTSRERDNYSVPMGNMTLSVPAGFRPNETQKKEWKKIIASYAAEVMDIVGTFDIVVPLKMGTLRLTNCPGLGFSDPEIKKLSLFIDMVFME